MATGDRILPRVEQDYTAFTELDSAQQNGAKLMGEHVILEGGSLTIPVVAIDQTTPGTTNGVVVNSAIPGTGATNLGKAEDAAHTSGDVGVMALAVRNDANAAFSGTDGDYTPIRVDSAGNVATKDQGPAWTVTRTVTSSADMSTAAAISPTPGVGNLLVGDDFIISTDTAMSFTIQEETSGTVFAVIYLPANGTAVITTRDGLKTAVTNKKFFGKASVPGNVSITAMTHAV